KTPIMARPDSADFGKERKVIGGAVRRWVADHLARQQPLRMSGRCEHVVEADVRIPNREGQASILGMKLAESIDVARVQDHFDRPPANPAPAQPDERAQARGQLPEIEDVARRKRVEVASEQMKTAIVLPDCPQQG